LPYSCETKWIKKKPSDLEGLMDVRYHNSKNLKKQLGKWIGDNVSEADKKSLKTFLKSL
jgi:predicted nucleotide-binding protein